MSNNGLKQLSQFVLVAGVSSVAISAIIYLQNAVRGGEEKGRHASLFVGLWAPSLFALSEMLDRVSEEDREFFGQTIDRAERVREFAGR